MDTDHTKEKSNKDYDVSISVLGAFPNHDIIFETLRIYNKERDIEEIKEKFIEENIFGIPLISSRKRFFAVIKKVYLNDNNKGIKDIFYESISNRIIPKWFKRNTLYLETCRGNQLFEDITIDLVYRKYLENRRLITSDEIYDFLLDYGKDTPIDDWSDESVKTLSTKYISLMKKLGKFEEQNRLENAFSFEFPDKRLIVYIVYLLKEGKMKDKEIFNSNLFKALMINEAEKIQLIKQGALSNFYDFSLSGKEHVDFSLKFKKDEILNELFNK